MAEPMTIDVLTYDGCYASVLFTVVDLARIAGFVTEHLHGEPPPFDARVVGTKRTVATADGTRIQTRPPRERPDLLVVPGFELDASPSTIDGIVSSLRNEIALIDAHANSGRPVASICAGAFVIGAAGLLDGRTCTTAWAFGDELARRHPAAHVDTSQSIIVDGNVTTTAAFSSANELALSLVAANATPEVARLTGRLTLTAANRPSQLAYTDTSPALAVAGFGQLVADELARQIDRPYDLTSLAARMHVSTRTLLRRFKNETGTSPLQHLHALRIRRAQYLLETTDRSFERIVTEVGYSDPATFRRAFVTAVRMTPSEYRNRFAVADLAPPS